MLVYSATPSRMEDRVPQIDLCLKAAGHSPFQPLRAFPRALFEEGPTGREQTMVYCERAIEMCDTFWMFGISDGTLRELVYALKLGKPVRYLFREWDLDWRESYRTLGPAYGNPLGSLESLLRQS